MSSEFEEDFHKSQFNEEDEEENNQSLRPARNLNPDRSLNPSHPFAREDNEEFSLTKAQLTSLGGSNLLIRAALNHTNQQQTSVEDKNTQLSIEETLSDREAQPIQRPALDVSPSSRQGDEKTLSTFNPSSAEDSANNSQSDSQSLPAPEITSPKPQQLKQTGEKFYLEPNYEAAYPIFSSLAKQDPKDLLIQFFLTVSATKVGKCNEAIAASNKLIKSGYRLNQAYYFQGMAYELQAQKDLARLAYQKARQY